MPVLALESAGGHDSPGGLVEHVVACKDRQMLAAT